MYRDKKTGDLVFSPTDLTRFWESEFVAWMDHYNLDHPGVFTPDDDDGLMKVLQAKGYQHETATIASLERRGRSVFKIDSESAQARQDTIDALQRGEDVIFQARLQAGDFAGWADFLVRVEGVSKLGNYHYEVWDTKLSSKMKPYFVLQLSAYAEMLEEIQGRRPENIAVVLGTGERQDLRLADYFFYYQSVKNAFLAFHQSFDPACRPDPEKYRSYGRWESEAVRWLEEQDALIQVAGLNSNQARNLKASGITTMGELARTDQTKIPKIGDSVLMRLKTQANLQIQSRGKDRPEYSIRCDNPQAGLFRLPAHSDGDVFFDIEGFPVVEGGLEYLWGNTYVDAGEQKFKDFWAHNRDEERRAFEAFIDWIVDRHKRWPDMHVYHYAHYEIGVIRRLMGRYATREHEVDHLMRSGVFVDLYAIVKHGLFVGEPRYSIKNIEHLYRGKRQGEVTDGGASVEFYDAWRNNPDGKSWEDSATLRAIRDYNIDDCDSTLELCQWLRARQWEAQIAPYLKAQAREAPEPLDADAPKIKQRLLAIADTHPEAMLLAHLTEFYWREAKPWWWKFFDRLASLPEDLYEDPDCLASLSPYSDVVRRGNRHQRIYKFDIAQECKIKEGDTCVSHFDEHVKFKVERLCYEGGYIELTTKLAEHLIDSVTLVPFRHYGHAALGLSVLEFCQDFLANPKMQHPVLDFLHRRPPRLKGSSEGPIVTSESPNLIADVIGVVKRMDHTTLCIQGPPGTGKTYTAEHVICELVKQGLRIGVTSNSHKAINNLLLRAATLCAQEGVDGLFVKVSTKQESDMAAHPRIGWAGSGNKVDVSSELRVVGGTAWCFASDNLRDEIDYLFIDEAGQVSIANLVAVSRSCKNIIVMGDQMQLAQPIQGSHPGDSGKSVLDYYLEEHATIPHELGIFLPLTYRMHPNICRFVSGAVYEDRLKSAPQCAQQRIDCAGSKFLPNHAGINFIPVKHAGNSQASDDEVVIVGQIAKDLIGREYINTSGQKQILELTDILFVAPYNLQVRKIQDLLGEEARVGSVDKFQGQEAPVVVLSMCCSDASSSYRGIEFLFSKNRLNVAISRAQIAAIVVGHPSLATTFAASLGDVEKVNMFCRLVLGR